MAKHYYSADRLLDDGTPGFDIKSEIDYSEIETILQKCDFLKDISFVQFAYEIAIANGRDLLAFLNKSNLNNLYKKGDDFNKIGLIANRLSLNFCASLRLFIDRVDNIAEKQPDEAKTRFKEFQRNLYDENFEYRFFYRLRNYTIHYNFPIQIISASIEDGVEVYCSRKAMLKYKKWGPVKADILQLPETFILRDYIETELALLTALWMQIHVFYIDNYIAALKCIDEFAGKYNLKAPMYICFDKPLQKDIPFEPNQMHPHFFQTHSLMKGIEILNDIPGIQIEVRGKKK